MTRGVVFLGPSLDSARRPKSAALSFLPPARKGDLIRQFECGARNLLLADVCFIHAPTPTHAELLWILNHGAKLVGTASAGALRAVELEAVGMVGRGVVFEAYKAGALTDDGEVAVGMCPITSQPQTIPLVNVRALLRLLQRRGVPSAHVASLFDVASGIHFLERSSDRLKFEMESRCPRYLDILRTLWPVDDWNVKARDVASSLRAFVDGVTEEDRSFSEELWL